MADTWGSTSPTRQAAGRDIPVSVMLAGPLERTNPWYQVLQLDARFRVAAMANDPQDMQAKLAASPEVIILDGKIFPGPQPLIQALTAIAGAVYLFVPPNADDELIEQLKKLPPVKAVFRGDANLQDLMSRAYADALALRIQAPALAQNWASRSGMTAVAGLRIVTVWGRSGGAGRTSVAAALAQAVARRGLRTLLIGLGAPDVLPLHLRLKSEPNIMAWFADPSDDGFRASLQGEGNLEVLVGFPDILAEAEGQRAPEEKGSIARLATSAAYGGYAAIIMDTPVAGVAPFAVAAANTWVMVARPTVADAWGAVEAFRTVTQRAAGQHRITPGNVFVVLNQRSNGMMTADEWHRSADAACRKMGLNAGFPPVAAVIPYCPETPLAQDDGRSALDAADEFARPIHHLAEMLFGQAVGLSNGCKEGKAFKLGPLKVRTK